MSIFKKSVTLMTHIFTVGISLVDTSVELHADPIFTMLAMDDGQRSSAVVSLLKLALKLLAVEGLKLHSWTPRQTLRLYRLMMLEAYEFLLVTRSNS